MRKFDRRKASLAIILEQPIGTSTSQPQIVVAIIIHIAKRGRHTTLVDLYLVGKLACAVIEPDRTGSALSGRCQEQIQIAVPIDVRYGNPWHVHGSTGPLPVVSRLGNLCDIG